MSKARRNQGPVLGPDRQPRTRAIGPILCPVMPMGAVVAGPIVDRVADQLPLPPSKAKPLELIVYGPTGRVIPGAEVTLTDGTASGTDVAVTDRHGRAVLVLPASQCDTQLLLEARGYWGCRIDRPVLHPIVTGSALTNTVVLSEIEGPAVDSPSWGLEAMRLDSVPSVSFLGRRNARCALIVAEVGQVALGQPVAMGAADHGQGEKGCMGHDGLSDGTLVMTHLLQQAAPEAEVTVLPMSVRPRVADAIAALDWCITAGMDVACLCFASAAWDDGLHSALKRARRAGVIVICPVGEAPGPVQFPAASDEVIAVGAVGHKAASPKVSAHAALNGAEGQDGFCLPVRAATGAGIDLVAPGIAIRADQNILSGSALAAVHVAGFTLCLLHTDEALHRLPRSGVRLLELTAMLRDACTDLGFASDRQGAGMPVWGVKGRMRKSVGAENALAMGAQAAMDQIARTLG